MYYIIYQTAFIGDIILSTSMVRTIKKIDSHGKVIFITTPAGKSVLQNSKLIDWLIVYDKRSADSGIRGLFRVVKNIKDIIGIDDSVFISPHRFIRASIIGFLIGSNQRTGFRNSALAFLYNRTVPYEMGIHETERNLRLLSAALPGRCLEKKPAIPELYPSENDFDNVRKIIYSGFACEDKIIAVAPGSVWATKRWPEEYYKKLADLLSDKGIRTILIGGSDDKELCGRISSGNSISLAGELSPLESAAAISLAAALVTNDSAPLHMASAMNIPTIALFGSTTPHLGFGPLAVRSIVIENKNLECRPCGRHGGMKCPKVHFDCMNKIYPERVFREILKIIEK